MIVVANGQERTIGQFVDLVDGTGWQLGSISRNHEGAVALLIFNPVRHSYTSGQPHADAATPFQ